MTRSNVGLNISMFGGGRRRYRLGAIGSAVSGLGPVGERITFSFSIAVYPHARRNPIHTTRPRTPPRGPSCPTTIALRRATTSPHVQRRPSPSTVNGARWHRLPHARRRRSPTLGCLLSAPPQPLFGGCRPD